jgi:hypothetical protein
MRGGRQRAMLAGVSTRRLRRTREPVGEQVTASER